MLSVAFFIAMLNVIMPSVIMLSVIMLRVIMLSVIMLNVVAPEKQVHKNIVGTSVRRTMELLRTRSRERHWYGIKQVKK
jgi:hypothetical protein